MLQLNIKFKCSQYKNSEKIVQQNVRNNTSGRKSSGNSSQKGTPGWFKAGEEAEVHQVVKRTIDKVLEFYNVSYILNYLNHSESRKNHQQTNNDILQVPENKNFGSQFSTLHLGNQHQELL